MTKVICNGCGKKYDDELGYDYEVNTLTLLCEDGEYYSGCGTCETDEYLMEVTKC